MATAHWTEDLFVRHPEVFLAVHEHAWATGEEQARDNEKRSLHSFAPQDLQNLASSSLKTPHDAQPRPWRPGRAPAAGRAP